MVKHSDALTDQQKADCVLVVTDWDTHCVTVLANITTQAAQIRFQQALAAVAQIPANSQTVIFNTMAAAIPTATIQAAKDAAKL